MSMSMVEDKSGYIGGWKKKDSMNKQCEIWGYMKGVYVWKAKTRLSSPVREVGNEKGGRERKARLE